MKYYVCQEGFAVGIDDGHKRNRETNVWFRAGQRVREDHPVFQKSDSDPDGLAAKHRMEKMFLPEDEEPSESFKRGPGRPRKESIEVNA